MAFTMACPNFKKSLKMVYGPLGVKKVFVFPKLSLSLLLGLLVATHG
jgi:serine protease inhibitor ecotin